MLEYNRNVRFLGRKDLMKVTHSVLEYMVSIRTRHAGIKYKCACKLNFFLPLCAYSVLEHNIFLTENRGITGTKFQWKKYWISVRKNVENCWECWQIRKTGGQNTSCFDTSVLKAACFTIVIFWKVRHYEVKSLFFPCKIINFSLFLSNIFCDFLHVSSTGIQTFANWPIQQST